jgi:hypothetical protein
MSSINQQLSLFVPYMFANITEVRVSKVFSALLLGEVSRVDFVPKTDKNGKSYNAAYIHFNLWYDSDTVAHFQERVTNSEKEARIVYDEPWYWIVLENTAVKMHSAQEMPKAQDMPKAQETEFVSSDYAAILENKLAALEKRLEELEESSWERIAELEERVADLEQDAQDELMQALVTENDYADMPALVEMM